MRSWAQWTAKTLMLTAGFAAAGAGLSGAAFAQAASGPVTSGNGSVGGGNQVIAPVTLPLDVCGNAAAVLGVAAAGCEGIASVTGTGSAAGSRAVTGGDGSVLGGNQVIAPVTAPVNVCGSSVAALGDSAASCKGVASAGGPGHGHKPPARHRCGCQAQPASKDMFAPVLPGGPGLPPMFWMAPWRPALPKGGGLRNASLAGLSTPVAADSGLPPSAGLASLPVSGQAPGAGELMPSGVLSAASAPGMSATSFFSLAAGALLAGVSALKIASRRPKGLGGSGASARGIRRMGMPA